MRVWHEEIVGATLLCAACVALNLWRATFLRHPYVSFQALLNRNVVRATLIYLVFFTLMATEHVVEHGYAEALLGFDKSNLADLNLYVLVGIVAGVAFTYVTFAHRRWRYKTMVAIGFALAAVYLAWFYFGLDYGVEKEALMLPLAVRGASSVIISIVLLTSIVQSGLHFFVFPQALTVNGFTGAVMGATLGPAIVGELLRHIMAANTSLVAAAFTAATPVTQGMPVAAMQGMVQMQALAVSMKEVYGWLLIVAVVSLVIITASYSEVRPRAIFPKWRSIRKALRRIVRRDIVRMGKNA